MKEVIVSIKSKPDNLNRQYFTISWLDNNIGYNCNEVGLRGQYFFGVLQDHLNNFNNSVNIIFE